MTNLNGLKLNQLNDCQKQLKENVDQIIAEIENCKYDFEANDDYEDPCAADYLNNVLEINYIIGSDKSYMGAILLVAFGGSNIWINTQNKQVEGYWGGDSYIQTYFDDKLGIDDYMEEVYSGS